MLHCTHAVCLFDLWQNSASEPWNNSTRKEDTIIQAAGITSTVTLFKQKNKRKIWSYHHILHQCNQGGFIVGIRAGLLGLYLRKLMTKVSDRRHRKDRTAAKLKLKGMAWPLQTNSNSFVSEKLACAWASCLLSCKAPSCLRSFPSFLARFGHLRSCVEINSFVWYAYLPKFGVYGSSSNCRLCRSKGVRSSIYIVIRCQYDWQEVWRQGPDLCHLPRSLVVEGVRHVV